jgi:CBS domain-containing protein
MLIQDVMTKTPACCKPSDRLDKVAKMMVEHNCGEIPVCDGAKLVGVITDRDITCRVVATGKTPVAIPASDVMTRDVYSIRGDLNLGAALDLMEEKLVRRLPVVDENDRIIGIVSQADLVARVPTLKVARLMKSVSKKTRKPAFARM